MKFRDISPEAWMHARQALVFYFSRRGGFADAEDLAQRTFMAMLAREDYEFEKEEDFLKICYGFAKKIGQEGYRDSVKHAVEESPNPLLPDYHEGSAQATEMRILLDETWKIGKAELSDEEWTLIRHAAEQDRANSAPDSNKIRVKLYRARQKLMSRIGWRTK